MNNVTEVYDNLTVTETIQKATQPTGGLFVFKDLPIPGLIFLCVVCAAGILGNVLIISAVLINKSLRTLNNAFIVNLAVADLIITSFVMPVSLSTSRRALDMSVPGYNRKICEAVVFFILTSMMVSTLSLTTIAVERYVHVCHSHFYRKTFTKVLCIISIGVIWVFAIAVGIQGFTGWARYSYIKRMFSCFYVPRANASFNLFLAFICFFIPVPTLIYCYGRIFWTVHVSKKRIKNKSKASNTKAENRLLLTLLVIVCVYFVCWGFFGCMLLAISLLPTLPGYVGPIGLWLSLSNSSMNGFIYGFMNTQFRAGYLMTVERLFPCLKIGKVRSSKTKVELSNIEPRGIQSGDTSNSGSKDTKDASLSESKQNNSTSLSESNENTSPNWDESQVYAGPK